MYPGCIGGDGGGRGRGEPGGGGANGGCGGGEGGWGGGGGGGEGGDGDDGGGDGGGGVVGGFRSGRSGSRPMSQIATAAGTPMSTVSAMHAMQHMPAAVRLSSVGGASSSSGCRNPSAGGRLSMNTPALAASSPVHVAGGSSTRLLRRGDTKRSMVVAVGGDAHTLSNVNASSSDDTVRRAYDMPRTAPRGSTPVNARGLSNFGWP